MLVKWLKMQRSQADPQVNFATYDNDGDGFVDAFIVIHAGAGVSKQVVKPISGPINGFYPDQRILLMGRGSMHT